MDVEQEIMDLRERVMANEIRNNNDSKRLESVEEEVEGLLKFRWMLLGAGVLASVGGSQLLGKLANL